MNFFSVFLLSYTFIFLLSKKISTIASAQKKIPSNFSNTLYYLQLVTHHHRHKLSSCRITDSNFIHRHLIWLFDNKFYVKASTRNISFSFVRSLFFRSTGETKCTHDLLYYSHTIANNKTQTKLKLHSKHRIVLIPRRRRYYHY